MRCPKVRPGSWSGPYTTKPHHYPGIHDVKMPGCCLPALLPRDFHCDRLSHSPWPPACLPLRLLNYHSNHGYCTALKWPPSCAQRPGSFGLPRSPFCLHPLTYYLPLPMVHALPVIPPPRALPGARDSIATASTLPTGRHCTVLYCPHALCYPVRPTSVTGNPCGSCQFPS